MTDSTRKRLFRKASTDKKLSARVAVAIKASPHPKLLTASQRRDLVEAIRTASESDELGRIMYAGEGSPSEKVASYMVSQGWLEKKAGKVPGVPDGTGPRGGTPACQMAEEEEKEEKKAAAKVEDLSKMPGFSPMQLRAEITRLSDLKREIEILRKQYDDVLAKLKGMEKEEKDGMSILRKAAAEMGKKGKFIAEAEKALLQFTAYSQSKRPGIEQMLAAPDDPDVLKKGLKAGDLFGRVAEQLGDEISKAVAEIYEQTVEDLTHTAMAVRGLKIVEKTASVNPAVTKRAGIMDKVVSLKEWLAGKTDSLAERILGFRGTISKWFKGFLERTKMVGKATNSLTKALAKAQKETDKLLKEAD